MEKFGRSKGNKSLSVLVEFRHQHWGDCFGAVSLYVERQLSEEWSEELIANAKSVCNRGDEVLRVVGRREDGKVRYELTHVPLPSA